MCYIDNTILAIFILLTVLYWWYYWGYIYLTTVCIIDLTISAVLILLLWLYYYCFSAVYWYYYLLLLYGFCWYFLYWSECCCSIDSFTVYYVDITIVVAFIPFLCAILILQLWHYWFLYWFDSFTVCCIGCIDILSLCYIDNTIVASINCVILCCMNTTILTVCIDSVTGLCSR